MKLIVNLINNFNIKTLSYEYEFILLHKNNTWITSI
jgi:hypothetical protein